MVLFGNKPASRCQISPYHWPAPIKVTPASRNNRRRVALAQEGYLRAVAAGTVDRIPNEGSE